jgi:hypothetical protein
MDCTYLKGIFLKQDGSVEPVTFVPDAAGWIGPEPVLQVMNDSADQLFTYSVHLRSRLEQMYLSARQMMAMVGLPPAVLATVQTLSWARASADGWIRLTIGMKEMPGRLPNRPIEGFDARGRQLEKGRVPAAYEPQDPSAELALARRYYEAKGKKKRPAAKPSPLLAKLMRNAQ